MVAASHVTPYNIEFFLVEFYATSPRAQRHLIVALSNHTAE